MSDDELKNELERLRNENAALRKGAATGITMKVSEKGGLSVYGMGRFPVTLYKEQWLKLLDMSDDIRAFIAANAGTLKTKGGALDGRWSCWAAIRAEFERIYRPEPVPWVLNTASVAEMQSKQGQTIFSATDLVNFLECGHPIFKPRISVASALRLDHQFR